MSKSVLFVDDEQNVLNSLKRTFFDMDYETFFALSGEEGLGILKNEHIDMVVSDMRMPQMNGYEFLKQARKVSPSIIRIILSGYAEKKTILKAIIDGTAKAYLTKPWDNTALKDSLENYFSIYKILRQKGLLDNIGKMEKIPVLPAMYHKIIQLIEYDRSIDEISAFIAKDIGYVAKILSIVNSSFYGVSIGSVKQAVVYLGLDTVKNIILSSEIFEAFRMSGAQNNQIDILWKHSALVNSILHKLYLRSNGKRIPEEYSSIGLLHDVGMLLILKYFPQKYMDVIKAREKDPLKSIPEIENEIVGIAHTELGGYILDWWNLPYYLIEACLFHHDPLNNKVNNKEIIALSYIADVFSWEIVNKNLEIKEIDKAIDKEVFKAACIDKKTVVNEIEENRKGQKYNGII